MPKDLSKDRKKEMVNKKWSELKKRGLTPPKNSDENRQRAKEAHGEM
jgi:hypothetical protein